MSVSFNVERRRLIDVRCDHVRTPPRSLGRTDSISKRRHTETSSRRILPTTRRDCPYRAPCTGPRSTPARLAAWPDVTPSRALAALRSSATRRMWSSFVYSSGASTAATVKAPGKHRITDLKLSRRSGAWSARTTMAGSTLTGILSSRLVTPFGNRLHVCCPPPVAAARSIARSYTPITQRTPLTYGTLYAEARGA